MESTNQTYSYFKILTVIFSWFPYIPSRSCTIVYVFAILFYVTILNKQHIAKQTRILDICGCLISAIAIMIFMILYRSNPALRHQRTTIHLFLFGAMLTNIIVQLLLYTDQAIVNGFYESLLGGMEVYRGINNTQYVCEAFYFVQEYSMTTIFMWILIDAVFISRCFSSNTTRFTFPLIRYAALSCLLCTINVAVWAGITGYFFEIETNFEGSCWFGYNFNKLYWILQGPRLFVIVINAFLLTYIMRILLPKLRKHRKTDMGKLKLAVRKTVCLLALLVLTSACSMIETDTWTIEAWVIALWNYTAHFFRSFQGLISVVLYCCLNQEVQGSVRRKLSLFLQKRTPENNGGTREQNIEVNQQATVAMIHDPLRSFTPERRQEASSRRMSTMCQEIYDQDNFDLEPESIEMNVHLQEPGPSRFFEEQDEQNRSCHKNPSSSEESDYNSDSDPNSNRYIRNAPRELRAREMQSAKLEHIRFLNRFEVSDQKAQSTSDSAPNVNIKNTPRELRTCEMQRPNLEREEHSTSDSATNIHRRKKVRFADDSSI